MKRSRRNRSLPYRRKQMMLEIQDVPQWLCWKFVDGRKVPINRHLENSGCNRHADFMTYADAAQLADDGSIAGVMGTAFVFIEGDGFFGVDLDNAGHLQGSTFQAKPWAQQIIDMAGSYAELSPGLKGVKIFCRGKLPVGCRHRFPVGDGEVEIYEAGRFFTFTNCGINDSGVNEFDPAPLLAMHTPEPQPIRVSIPTASGIDLWNRGLAYIQSASLPGEGARNNTAFSLAGHLRAMDDNGSGLGETQVMDLMQLWNSSLPEPLPENELRRVVDSSRRNGTPRQPKQTNIMSYPAADISAIVSTQPSPPLTPPADMPPDFPDLELRGLVGDLTRHITESALYPQFELALGAALSLMSVLTGRKIKDVRGSRSNLYLVCIAPSGAGKDYPRQVIREILIRCGGESLYGPSSIGSHAGLLSWLKDKSHATLFPLDEMGKLLATTKNVGNSHLFNINKTLLTLYSSAAGKFIGDAYADTKRTVVIDEPHCVVYGSTTPGTFWGGLSEEALTDGLVARFLVLTSGYVTSADDYRETETPQDIVDRCAEWVRFNPISGNLQLPEPKVVQWTSSAERRLVEHGRAIDRKRISESEAEAAVWSRVAEKTGKIAMLIACGRQSPEGDLVVDEHDANQAIKISNWSCRHVISNFGQVGMTAFGRDVCKVADWIKTRRETSQTEISRRFRGMKRKDRMEVIASLMEEGKVDMEVRTTDGRNGTVYVWKW